MAALQHLPVEGRHAYLQEVTEEVAIIFSAPVHLKTPYCWLLHEDTARNKSRYLYFTRQF